jgi:hypothetical protein
LKNTGNTRSGDKDSIKNRADSWGEKINIEFIKAQLKLNNRNKLHNTIIAPMSVDLFYSCPISESLSQREKQALE